MRGLRGLRALGAFVLGVWPAVASAEPVAARIGFVRADGSWLDPDKDGVSPTREAPPSTLETEAERAAHVDWVRVGGAAALDRITLVSRSVAGREMDRVVLRRGEGGFEPIRLVTESSDRYEAARMYRSAVVEFGGAIELLDAHEQVLARARVTGPFGLAGALRLRVRALVVRYDDRGASGAGGSDREAERRLTRDLRSALTAWGQCGIGVSDAMPITFVPKPASHLLAVGAGYGLPASGGSVALTVAGKPLRIRLSKGASPLGVALQIAAAGRKLGFRVDVAENERSMAQAGASVDLSFRTRAGAPVELSAPGPLTDDATLDLRIGVVDLRDGLDHFREEDSQTGTLEERTLLRGILGTPRANSSSDPTQVALVLVPAFSGSGARLGESFIPSDGSTLAPMVIVDQRGVSMGSASMVAPHELGHVLLDQPGHPDAFGTDTPTRLMDSDASDGSAYGPRRITLDECRIARERSLSRKLLEKWPLGAWPAAKPASRR